MMKQRMPLKWLCPWCYATIDISAPKRETLQVCACGRAGMTWDRAAGVLRVRLAALDGPDLQDGSESRTTPVESGSA